MTSTDAFSAADGARPDPGGLPLVGGTPVRPRDRRDPASRRRRIVPRVVLAVVLLLVVLGGWLVFRGWQAASALLGARDEVVDLQDALDDRDLEVAQAHLTPLQEHAAKAHGATSDPVWRLAAAFPWGGQNLAAVAAISEALDLASREVLPPAVEAAGMVKTDALEIIDGQIDLETLGAAAPLLASAAAASSRTVEILDPVDTTELLGIIAGPVGEARETLLDVDGALQRTASAAVLLPAMLGADGPRSYLAMFLNSAELRSAGGLPGALAVLNFDDGRMSLGEQSTAAGMGRFDEPVLPLTEEELAIHGDRLGRYVQNTMLTPEFPRGAQLAQEMWRQETGQVVDGVLAVDVTALSYVLQATGSVTTPDGVKLKADTLVEDLLFNAYVRMTPQETDVFFAGAVVAMFDALAGGEGDPVEIMDALAEGAQERRVLVWSADQAEQGLLADNGLGGDFLSGSPRAIGVFLDDGTEAKLGYFLRARSEVLDVACEADGSARVRLGLELESKVPAEFADLPAYVVGNASAGVPIGSVRTRITLYAPVDGQIGPITRDGVALGGTQASESGRAVVVLTSELVPGQLERYELEVVVPKQAGTGDPVGKVRVLGTPTTTRGGVLATADGC